MLDRGAIGFRPDPAPSEARGLLPRTIVPPDARAADLALAAFLRARAETLAADLRAED